MTKRRRNRPGQDGGSEMGEVPGADSGAKAGSRNVWAAMLVTGLARGAASMAPPPLGGLLSEVVGQLIPDARLKRLSEFVEELDRRVSDIQEEELRSRFRRAELINLTEEALLEAARAESARRARQLAALLSRAVRDEASDLVKERHLLRLQGDLSDTEILTLMSFHPGLSGLHGGFKDQRLLIHGPLGSDRETPEGKARTSIAGSQKNHLGTLRLLYSEYMKPKPGQPPVFDSATGKLVGMRYLITPLGELLLEYLGLLEPLTERLGGRGPEDGAPD